MKTNVMRILEENNIDYEPFFYDASIDPKDIAKSIGLEDKFIFKTIVCVSNEKKYYVFVLNINDELNLKKCAKLVKEKNLELIKMTDLPKITGGYVRGGTSPIGMKKLYETIIDLKVIELDRITISGGLKGVQVRLNPFDLQKLINAQIDDITL